MGTIKKFLLSLVVMLVGVTATFADGDDKDKDKGVEYKAIIVYGDNLQYPMPKIVANLHNDDGEFIASSTTKKDGIFEFENLEAGESYTVNFSTELKPFGVDLADAYLLLKYLYGRTELGGLQLAAADVNGDNRVNFSDFAFIVSNWYLRGEKFPAGDWVMPSWTFTASKNKAAGPDGPITIVSTADISSELPPVIKTLSTVRNIEKEFVYNEKQNELSLPISFVKNQMVYSLGLEMAFDNLNVEILGINSSLDNADYVINGNTFKLSWVSDRGESFVANQDFLTLTIRLNSFEDIAGVLSNITEAQFVGEGGNLLPNVQLNMPKFKKSISEISFGNPYPNPGNNEINFTINQAYAESVQVEIYNLAGQLVKQIIASPKNSKITILTSDLLNGSYLCSLNIDNNRVVKLINVQH